MDMPPISWSDLPDDLLDFIAKRLDSYYDVLRLRGVCSSWRSAISLPRKRLPLELPYPIYYNDHDGKVSKEENCLQFSMRTIYSLRPLHKQDSNSSSPSSADQSGWRILSFQEIENGQVKVFDPFGGGIEQPPPPPPIFSKVLDLLNFRVSQVTCFFLVPRTGPFSKLILSSKPVSHANDYAVVASNRDRILYYTKLGDTQWQEMSEIYYNSESQPFRADGMVEHKGKFYVVDAKGMVIVLSYNFRVIDTFSFPSCENSYCSLHFIESLKGDDLFVVHNHFKCKIISRRGIYREPCEIKVYKLDNNQRKWKEVDNLDGMAFVVCQYCCFSVSVQDFKRFKSNCVYFVDRYPIEISHSSKRSSSMKVIRPPYILPISGVASGDSFIRIFDVKDGSLKRFQSSLMQF